MRVPRTGALLLASMLAACEVGPNYDPPKPGLPDGWTEARVSLARAQATAPKLREWWTEFRDPVLTRLVDQAIAGNYDLQIARQHLVAARAERVIAGSAEYPQIDFGSSYALSYSSKTLQWPPGLGEYRTFETGFDASWEIDIFGGTRRAEEAADAGIGATIEQRRATLISLLAELATDYVTLRATQLRIAIAERNVRTAQQAYDLAATEFNRGLTTSLATAQAKAQVDTVQASLPPLHAQVAQLTHAIALLLGAFPGSLEADLSRPAAAVPVPPDLPLSLPSEVAANRPDIRAAERQLAVATARIGVAVAHEYPSFSIPLMLDPTSSWIRELFSASSLVWSAGLSLKQSVFTGGKLSAQETEARAAAEAARLRYQQTVLTALKEVEDTLVAYSTETQRTRSLHEAVTDSSAAYDRAQKLYGAGLTDFLNVLTSERTLYTAEDQAALSDLARVREVIALYKALGGGWQAISFGDETQAAPAKPQG